MGGTLYFGMTSGLGIFCWELRQNFPCLFYWAKEKECLVRDMVSRGWGVDGRAWMWSHRLFTWEEDSMRECSLWLHNIILQDAVHDTWRWLLDPIHGYTVRGAYTFLTSTGAMVDMSNVDDVWHNHIPWRSLLVWRLLRNRIPTKDNMVLPGILPSTDMSCAFGYGWTESAVDLFIHCTFSGKLWDLVWNWLGISYVHVGELRHHFIQFTKVVGMPISLQLYFRIIWFATVWVI